MGGSSGSSSFLLIFMVLAVIGLFFMNSRARKKQAEATAFRTNLQAGQEVMTSSGMFGTVVAVDGDKVTLISSGGQESVWLLAAIAKLVEEEPELDDDVDDDEVAVQDTSAESTDPTSRYIAGAADVRPADLGPENPTTPRDEPSR